MDLVELKNLISVLNNESAEELERNIVIDKLILLFQNVYNTIDVQTFVAQVLNTQNGVLRYLTSIACSLEGATDDSKKIFELLGYLVTNYSSAIDAVLAQTLPWCIGMLRCIKPIRVQVIKWMELVFLNCNCLEVDFASVVEAIKEFLSGRTKISFTLRQVSFSLLGALCIRQPVVMESFSDWFINILMKAFREFDVAQSVSIILLEGCFQGLKGYLKSFSLSDDLLLSVYDRLKTFCELSGQKHTLNRAALSVFVEHGLLFEEQIYVDREFWELLLNVWIYQRSENELLGLAAFDKFYEVLAKGLVCRDAKNEFDAIVCPLLVQLESPSGNKHSVQKVISGVANLRVAFQKYSSDSELRVIINCLIALGEKPPSIYGSELKKIFQAPCLIAISKLFSCLENPGDVMFLTRLSVALIENFSDLPVNFQTYSLQAIENSFCALAVLKAVDYQNYLDQVIYQGLIRSCSHTLHVDAQLLEEKEQCVSYKSFLPLWIHVLSITRRSNDQENVEERQIAAGFVYDTFIKSFLLILSKLDLSLTPGLEERSDPSLALEASTPNDFHIFVNLVDLFEDTILQSDYSRLQKWLPVILEHCMESSRARPLVSGFYRIISVLFEVGSKLGYFNDNLEVIELIVPFLETVIVRIHGIQGELEIACLKMILVAPTAAILNLLPRMDIVLLSAARAGRGYLPILAHTISALDKWLSDIPICQMEPILKELLPEFDVLLQSVGFVGVEGESDSNFNLKSRGKFKKKIITSSESELITIQKMFLRFLGKLEPGLCKFVLKPPESNAITEGSNLVYKLPLPDIRLNVDLNRVLPRVIQVAVSGGDRKTRVVACEVLNAVLLLSIESTRHPDCNVDVFEKLLTTSLVLSCDSDIVVSNMFKPLMHQVTHYFSNKVHFKSKESGNLIKVLMGGVTHPNSAGVRDFAADCIREYLVWCEKQSSEELNIADVNIVAVIRTVCSYAVHPDRCKRLGAAIVINNIYAVIREKKTILNSHWLQLFYSFVCNLRMCFNEDDARILKTALNRLRRPFLEVPLIFMTRDEARRVPVPLGNGLLQDVIIFTFQECRTPNRYLRETAQVLTIELIRHYPGGTSLQKFIEDHRVEIAVRVSEATSQDFKARVVAAMDYTNWLMDMGSFELKSILTENSLSSAAPALLKEFAENPFDFHSDLLITLKFAALVANDLDHEALCEISYQIFNMKSSSEDIMDVLTTLLKKIYVFPTKWGILLSKIPDLSEKHVIACINSKNLLFLRGLLVLIRSNTIKNKYTGVEVLKAYVSILFSQRGRSMITAVLEPQFLNCLSLLLPFVLECGVNLSNVMDILTDDLAVDSDGKTVKRGEYFFHCFKDQLVTFILGHDLALQTLLNLKANSNKWMLAILQTLQRRSSSTFATELVIRWETISSLENSNKEELLLVLKAMANVAPNDFGFFTDSGPSRWLLYIVRQRSYSVVDRLCVSAFFEMMPMFSTLEEDSNADLVVALNDFRRFHKEYFGDLKPIQHSDLPVSMAMYSGLCKSLTLTGSLVVLQFLAKQIILSNDMTENTKYVFATAFPNAHVYKGLIKLFEDLFSLLSLEENSKNVLSWMTSILNHAATKVVFDFFVKVLPDVYTIIKQLHAGEESAEEFAMKRIAAVSLLQVFYLRTSMEQRREIESRIVQDKEDCKGLFPNMINICSKQVKPPGKLTPGIQRLFRLVNSECVKLMCTVAAQFQVEQPYKVYIFSNFLTRNTIDCEKEIILGMDFNQLPQVKKLLTTIRSSNKQCVNPSLNYAHSVTLFNSTLSEDVRKFDFSDVALQRDMSDVVSIELEMDDLNQHELVPAICGVIQHMTATNVPCKGKVPCWLEYFNNLFSDPQVHRNVKIIALKLCHNLSDVLAHYPDDCAPSIIKTIVSTFSTANYLIIDLVTMVLSWKTNLTGYGDPLYQLIDLFVTKSAFTRKDIARSCLTCVKAVVECWKDVLDCNSLSNLLLSICPERGQNELSQYIALMLASTLLANQLIANQGDIVDKLSMWLIKTVESDGKNRELAAQVLGMFFSNFPESYKKLTKNIKALSINLIYAIHKFYPSLAADRIGTLISNAYQSATEIKRQSLEMLTSHFAGNPEEIQEEMILRALIVDSLKSPIVILQEQTLKLFQLLVPIFSEESLSMVIPHVTKLNEQTHAKVRQLVCDALIAVTRRFPNYTVLYPAVKVALLKGLKDNDEEVHQKAIEFWFDARKIGQPTFKYLLWILSELCDPNAESDFVKYTCKLLLKSSTTTADFEKDIFDHPLEKTTFTEYQILASYRAKNISLAPMFAPSVATELTQMSVIKSSQTFRQQQIRATAQSLLFAPTQAGSQDSNQSFSSQPVMDGVFKRPTTAFRHLRSATSVGNLFAKRAVAKKVKEESEAVEKVKRRDGTVQLYRAYRKGDFPDIQIKHSSFIATLTVLLGRDSQIAKDVFLTLVSGIVAEISENNWQAFWHDASSAVSAILNSSNFSNPLFLSTMFQFTLNNKLCVSSEQICQAAKASGLLSLGILLIEHNISNQIPEETSAKRQRGPESEEDKDWLRLGQLLQDSGDVDGLRGVFLDKLVVEGAVAAAIHLEAEMNWIEVKEKYEQVFSENTESDDRFEFYNQAYYNCLAQLSNWDVLAKSIYQTVGEKELLEDPWSRDVFLPLYVRSKMMTTLEGNDSEFQKFMLESSHANYLNGKYPGEVAIAKWLTGHSGEVGYFLNDAYGSFLKEWSQASEWDFYLKLASLKRLPFLSEIEKIEKVCSVNAQDSVVYDIAKMWNISEPKLCDDLVDWDTRLAIRAQLTAQVHGTDRFSEDAIHSAQSSLLKNRLSMVKSALNFNNMRLAHKGLKTSRDQLEDADDYHYSTWCHYVNLTKMLEIRLSNECGLTKINNYMNVWCEIEKKIGENMDTDAASVLTALSMFRIVTEILNLSQRENIDLSSIESILEDKVNVKAQWLKLANVCISEFGNDKKWASHKGDTYVRLAKFHRNNLGSWSDVTGAVLKGMQLANSEARQLFGCLLTMDDVSNFEELEEDVKNVPSWMFLLWRHQLLATLAQSHNLPQKEIFVKAVLLKIIEEYPHTLSYGLRVSLENYDESLKNSYFIKELTAKVLSNQEEQLFVEGIEKIVDPYLKLIYLLEKALLISSKPKEAKNYLYIWKRVLADPDNGNHYNDVRKFEPEVDELINCDEDLKGKIKEFIKRIEAQLVTRKLSPRLKMFSKFLSEYQKLEPVVDIPGQYDVDHEPRMSSIVKIAGFSQELTPLPSKRRPFKLTIIGNDAKEYPFLVKFGEDLRQDERIQHVFTLMTNTLQNSKMTEKLGLERYSVIPFSCSHGLVTWVNDTRSLNSLIFTKEEQVESMSEAQSEHMLFLGGGRQRSIVDSHLNGYIKEETLDIAGRYKTLVSKFDANGLRQALWILSSSAEQFVYIRNNFACSVGVMNIAHWVLGVGDRHLENILLCTRTGRVVGIDFGLAFGFATQTLTPPELVPFRLTPNLVQVLSPLNESGWLKQTMIYTLKVLREDPSIILAVLEAFVQEPCLDWEEHAQRQARDLSDDVAGTVWVARQKIADVEGKLKGANPVVTFESDLSCGHKKNPAYSKFLKVVKGRPEMNKRAVLDREGLSAEQQVDCLIDLATDPLVLGLTYVGWKPWI